jgi:hypothetical protein
MDARAQGTLLCAGTSQPVDRSLPADPLIPENIMSDPRPTDPLRRLNLAEDGAAGMTWTTVWTWLAAIAAAAVVLALAFGYDQSNLALNQSDAPTTTGSAADAAPPAPLSGPGPVDVVAPAPAMPAGDQ